MTRRLLLILFIGSVAGIGVALFNPVNNFFLRLLLIGSIAGTFATLFALAKNRKRTRAALLLIPALTVIPFLLPSREMDTDQIKKDYLSRLVQEDKVPYHWGGESSGGIVAPAYQEKPCASPSSGMD